MEQDTGPTIGVGVQIAPTKTITADGSAGNGAIGTVLVWTITGTVLFQYMTKVCTLGLAGATSQIALGVPGSVAVFEAAVLATNFLSANVWSAGQKASPQALAGITGGFNVLITDVTINVTVTVAAWTGGTLVFDASYYPLTPGATLS